MNKHKNKTDMIMISGLVIFVFLTLGQSSPAQESMDWPREITVPEGKIVIYQPQLETFQGDRITTRAALSVTKTGESEAVWGAVWFAARVATDRDERIVKCLDITIPQARFHNAKPEQLQKLTAILEREIPQWKPVVSLDRFLAMIALIEKEKTAAESLKTDPPQIIFSQQPAVLITIDGEPLMRKEANLNLMRVINTPFFLVFDPASAAFYLKGGEQWFSTGNIAEPWQNITIPPDVVHKAATKYFPQKTTEPQPTQDSLQIVAATKPTELIFSKGEPQYSPIEDTNLKYMNNTTGDVFFDSGSGQYFVLLSGRWFQAAELTGPWSSVLPKKLPGDFAKIPPGNIKEHILVHVAGTVSAQEAVNDLQIPQTAAINRQPVHLTVRYDGSPKYEKMENSNMQYAINTPFAVFRLENKYYCCHNAIWFNADNPSGPWNISESVPDEIYTIPPSCPHYSVKFVYVYDATPDIVYVGYTPGYVGSYVLENSVVYGTGYDYHPWHEKDYYSRVQTWGYNTRFNPITGDWIVQGGYQGNPGWVIAQSGNTQSDWWGPAGYSNLLSTQANQPASVSPNIYHKLDQSWLHTEVTPDDRPPAAKPEKTTPSTATVRARMNAQYIRAQTMQQKQMMMAAMIQQNQMMAAQMTQQNNVFVDPYGMIYRITQRGWEYCSPDGWVVSTGSGQISQSQYLANQQMARQRGAARSIVYLKGLQGLNIIRQ